LLKKRGTLASRLAHGHPGYKIGTTPTAVNPVVSHNPVVQMALPERGQTAGHRMAAGDPAPNVGQELRESEIAG
jgi:hypothetical protein